MVEVWEGPCLWAEAMCSGVWGITDQWSPFRLADEEDRRVVERRAPGRNAKNARDEMVPEDRHGTLGDKC